MIESIDIEGFRGIKRTKEPIPLSDFTLLVGRNNSGKTSVLEALYALYDGTDPVLGNNRSNVIKHLHSGNSLAYRYSGSGSIEIIKDNQSFKQKVGDRVSANNNIGRSHDALYYPPSFKSLENIYSNLQSMREDIEKDGIHIKVTELLNQSINDEYTEIYLETLEMRKQPPDGNQFYVDVKDLGDGILRAIPVYLMVETIEPELFLWDDIDTSLHPGLTRDLIEWLAQKDTQFVGATHSIDVLSALIDIQPETDVSIVQLSKSGDDVLEHTELDLDELELMMENAGHDPRFMTNKLEL